MIIPGDRRRDVHHAIALGGEDDGDQAEAEGDGRGDQVHHDHDGPACLGAAVTAAMM